MYTGVHPIASEGLVLLYLHLISNDTCLRRFVNYSLHPQVTGLVRLFSAKLHYCCTQKIVAIPE
jgi:hypothetical protein